MLAVPLAFLAALNRDARTDTVIRVLFQIGLSMPVFYLGLVLLTFFAVGLRWFPVGGFSDNLGSDLYHLFLPALTLALSLSAVLMRNLRNSIIEVLNADYVDFARAKGLRSRLVLGRHVLRNALISTVALFGLNIGTLIGGAVITESVFAIPGVGRLMIEFDLWPGLSGDPGPDAGAGDPRLPRLPGDRHGPGIPRSPDRPTMSVTLATASFLRARAAGGACPWASAAPCWRCSCCSACFPDSSRLTIRSPSTISISRRRPAWPIGSARIISAAMCSPASSGPRASICRSRFSAPCSR